MPLTREQTSYNKINNTVFLPTVAIDNNLGVRGNTMLQGNLTVVGSTSFLGSTSFSGIGSFGGTTIGGDNGSIELNAGLTTNIYTYIDFHTSPGLDFDARIIKNGGSTGSWDFNLVGLSSLNLVTSLSPIVFSTTSTERMRIAADGTTTISGNLVQNINTTAKTAAYQLTTADANTVVQMNGAFNFTVDTSLAVLPLGTTITLVAQTAGVAVATTANATVPTVNATPGLKLRAAWSTASLIKMSAASASGTASTWLLTGDLTA